MQMSVHAHVRPWSDSPTDHGVIKRTVTWDQASPLSDRGRSSVFIQLLHLLVSTTAVGGVRQPGRVDELLSPPQEGSMRIAGAGRNPRSARISTSVADTIHVQAAHVLIYAAA